MDDYKPMGGPNGLINNGVITEANSSMLDEGPHVVDGNQFYHNIPNPNVSPVPMESLAALHEGHKGPDFFEKSIERLQELQQALPEMTVEKKDATLLTWYNLILSIQYVLFTTLEDIDHTLHKKGINAILELKAGGFDKMQGVMLHAHNEWI